LDAAATSLSDNELANALKYVLADNLPSRRFMGSATQLFQDITFAVNQNALGNKTIPKTAMALGSAMRALAPQLRSVWKWDVEITRATGGARVISLGMPEPCSMPDEK
jgi:hypothetical protein